MEKYDYVNDNANISNINQEILKTLSLQSETKIPFITTPFLTLY